MFDLQVVTMRISIPVHRTDTVDMVGIRNIPTGNVVRVEVDSVEAAYIVTALDALLVELPQGNPQPTAIAVYRDVDGSGEAYEVVQVPDLNMANPGSSRVYLDRTVLHLSGAELDTAVSVYVNGFSVPFTVIGPGAVYCQLPRGIASISKVEVFGTSVSVNRESYFAYTLGGSNPALVRGPLKAVGQFLKVLFTSVGSDVFSPSHPAGNLQSWVGSTSGGANGSAILTRTVLSVQTVGAQFVAVQSLSTKLPPDEKIASISVVSYGIDRKEPSVMQLGLKITMVSGQTVVFDALLGSIGGLIQQISGA